MRLIVPNYGRRRASLRLISPLFSQRRVTHRIHSVHTPCTPRTHPVHPEVHHLQWEAGRHIHREVYH